LDQGWIKLHRLIRGKPIWRCSTCEQRAILIELLLMVNYEANEWMFNGEKYSVQPGQCITSLNSIAELVGANVTVKQVRTALKKFENMGFLANQSTNKNRLITIVNWDLYQCDSEMRANKKASNRQAKGN